MTSVHHSHAPGYRAIRWHLDWITRPLVGLGLAAIAVVALFAAPSYFAILVVLITWAAAREWHRMVGRTKDFRAETLLSAATIAIAVAVLLVTGTSSAGLAVIAVGAVIAFLRARYLHLHPFWQALGPLYLGLPALALASLRAFEGGLVPLVRLNLSEPRGALVIVGMFLIVWATDTGALIFGNLIGGPRLAPRLSPSKTWAGTIGGSVAASLVFALYILFLGGGALGACLFGFLFSLSAHAGDLFESFVKRRFGFKNSGSLIPGHGGVLDRMDSTVLISMVLAGMVFIAHFDPLFGAAS
ncbi:MAG: phosphatidate cytidylyltransferase [Rhizomicrobium sp.]